MNLFNQIDFSGGLDAEFDRTKVPANSYPLLINGRTRDGVITPVKKHLEDTSLINGNYQDLVVVGDFLVIFVDGEVFYRNVTLDGAWQKITNWDPPLSSTLPIYTEVVPITTNVFNRRLPIVIPALDDESTPDEAIAVYNPQIAQTPQGLFITNGFEQPRILFYDLSWKELNNFSQWSQDDPEYVPVGILPRMSGTKLLLVSPTGTQVYASVSGRALDFVINIKSDGSKGGDATTFATAVDFNPTTAVQPIEAGGFICTTLFATYMCLPSGQELFKEPVFTPQLAFPVGCVNQNSFADLIGDTAFISPGGIQSFNVTGQLKRLSNNFPISKAISRYLANPNDLTKAITQSNTAAINYDDYALFSLDTAIGRAVAVYDTVRKQFVSFDTGFGIVKKFAVYRKAGVTRLFFINTDNKLFEAYADPINYNTPSLLLGDYVVTSEGVAKQHKIDSVYLAFTGASFEGQVRIDYYSDNELVDSSLHGLNASTFYPPPPSVIPFPNRTDITHIAWGVPARVGYKTSIQLSWNNNAKLVGVSLGGGVVSTLDKGTDYAIPTTTNNYSFIGEPGNEQLIASSGSSPLTAEVLIPGELYYISGYVNLGDRIIYNQSFIATDPTVTFLGFIYNVKALVTTVGAIGSTDYLFTLGSAIRGKEPDYQRFADILKQPFDGPATELDLDPSTFPWYSRHERYGIVRTSLIDFFHLSSIPTEPDGITADSDQADWLKYWLAYSDRKYKVVITSHPPYSDFLAYPDLRWPFREWGANLVISGKTKAYERFYINGLTYIVNGVARGTFDYIPAPKTSSTRITDTTGYVRLVPTQFELTASFYGVTAGPTSTLLDATTIYT